MVEAQEDCEEFAGRGGLFLNRHRSRLFSEDVYLYYAKPEAWEMYPEVLEVLHALRDYPVDLVVLSNWDARLHTVLDGLGLGEYLPQRFISSELGWEKPNPAIYRHVADVLRLPPKSLAECWRQSSQRC